MYVSSTENTFGRNSLANFSTNSFGQENSDNLYRYV